MGIDIDYINLLVERQDNCTLKVPKPILLKIVSDRVNYKAIELYLSLKPIFYDGRFKKANKKRKELAVALQMSESKMRRCINRLVKLDLAYFDESGDLLLCSWETLFNFYDHKREDKRKLKYYRLENSINIRLVLRQLAIEQNLNNQEKQIYIKLYKEEILYKRQLPLIERISRINKAFNISTEDKKRITGELSREIQTIKMKARDVTKDPEFKRMKKNGLLEAIFMQQYKEFYNLQRQFNIVPGVNFDISISCQKTAHIFGLKSASSGYYWQRFLVQNKRLEVTNRSIFLPENKIGSGLHYLDPEEINFYYFRGNKRGYFRRLNNLFKFAPLVQA